MPRIVIELTNRCNLSCQHCFAGRHGGKDDLPLGILDKILLEARPNGFDYLAFTGGEPTVHPQFTDVLHRTHAADYDFGLVTNGSNFPAIYEHLLRYQDKLSNVTFSLDGATEQTHDRLRGNGSFRRVLAAMSICVVKDIPFTMNMVVTAHNRHEVAAMAHLATKLGSEGLRFGHLIHSPRTTLLGFDLSPWQRKLIEAEIWSLRDEFCIPIAMGPGYHTTSLFPCAPLLLQEINVDCRGVLTKCCHLSGQADTAEDTDLEPDSVGRLTDFSLAAGLKTLAARNDRFHDRKLAQLNSGAFQDTDFFPCWYCCLQHKKVGWLRNGESSEWSELVPEQLTAGNSQ